MSTFLRSAFASAAVLTLAATTAATPAAPSSTTSDFVLDPAALNANGIVRPRTSLNNRGDTGVLRRSITDPRFDVPTAIAPFDGRLYLPNARFRRREGARADDHGGNGVRPGSPSRQVNLPASTSAGSTGGRRRPRLSPQPAADSAGHGFRRVVAGHATTSTPDRVASIPPAAKSGR